MYSLCSYYLNIYFLKYILPWYTSYIIIFHSTRLEYLNQSLSPHHRSNKVDCYVYISPHFIDTDHTTDVSIRKYFTYIIYIIGPIIGGRVVGVRVL